MNGGPIMFMYAIWHAFSHGNDNDHDHDTTTNDHNWNDDVNYPLLWRTFTTHSEKYERIELCGKVYIYDKDKVSIRDGRARVKEEKNQFLLGHRDAHLLLFFWSYFERYEKKKYEPKMEEAKRAID